MKEPELDKRIEKDRQNIVSDLVLHIKTGKISINDPIVKLFPEVVSILAKN